MSPRSRAWLRRLLIVPPLLVGVLVLVWQGGSETRPQQRASEEMSRAVRAITARPVVFVPRATGYGTVQPDRVWEAVAQVSGKIVEEHPDLDKGRLIPAGTVVLRIDPTDYELAVARNRANLQMAKAKLAELEVRAANMKASLAIERRALKLLEEELARQRALLKRGNTSQSLVDQTEAKFLAQRQRVQELENQLRLLPVERQSLEASIVQHETQIEEARLNLERTVIRLPFDARIAEVNVEPTQFVKVGDTLMVADGIDIAEVEAQFSIGRIAPLVRADIDLSSLSAGELAEVPGSLGLDAVVRLRTDSVAASWDARFERLSERIDPQTRTVGMIVAVDEPYRKTIPGKRPPLVKDMFVEVELSGRPRPNTLVVPRTALHRNDAGDSVLYLVGPDGRLAIREVVRGPVQGDIAVIEKGLEPDERVIISDLIPAIAGMKLIVHEDAALAERLRLEANGTSAQEAALR
jgi:RND family efflux transporter MFP subunit